MEEQTYLADIERDEIQKFLENRVLVEAVKKVILSGVYEDGILQPGKPADPLKNFVLGFFTRPNIALLPLDEKAKHLEAIIHAVSYVETGFQNLDKMRKIVGATLKKEAKHR